MHKICYVFDLDDTLVFYGKKGPTIPRQTFHTLRQLRGPIVVVSYNPLAHILASELGLMKYVNVIICGDCDRNVLVENAIKNFEDSQLVYFDDRVDNLSVVKQFYPRALCYHVSSALLLHRIIKRHLEESFTNEK